MANLSESSTWQSGIYQIETTDLVKGGALPDGISNLQAKQLADRTSWLKTYSGVKNRFLAIASISANTSINTASNGKLIYDNITSNITLTFDVLANFNDGDILTVATRTVSGTSVKIKANGSETINFNGDNVNQLWLLQQEYIELTKLDTEWLVTDCSQSLLETGDCLDAYKQRPNTVVRMGQLLNRSEYPRLWQWCLDKLADGQELLDEVVWQSNIAYKGCFSRGNGTTTFRLPDDRSMFTRYLDLGAGIDYERPQNYAGGYQADTLKAHDHVMHGKGTIPGSNYYLGRTNNRYAAGGGTDGFGGSNTPDGNMKTGDTGGTETRPKNTAKLPLIKI